MNMTCLAVDDEPLALDIIETYTSRVDWLQLQGRCLTAMETIAVLREHPVDILFLDIQLPDLNGFELLASLPHPPRVIFTTAYEQFGAQSYTVDAVDYLVKPFSFERFLRAVQKAADAIIHDTHSPGADATLFIHTDEGDVRINAQDILYVQGMNEYAVVRTRERKFTVREPLKDIERRLSRYGFLRVHKSWIVAVNSIALVDHNVLRVGDAVIPVGKTYRDSLRAVIDRRRIG